MIGLTRKSLTAAAISAAFASQLIGSQSAFADGGDFQLDFAASEPTSYDHSTGGGAYNSGIINTDVVESLEGGDFGCFEIVTFLTQIRVDAGAVDDQTARLRYEFTAHATGQQGVALVDNITSGVSADINSSAIDTGTADDGGSSATVFSEGLSGPGVFIKPTIFFREVDVTDLDKGETVVLRTDVQIHCNGASPTGNMQARLTSASVIDPAGEVSAINVGDQTIPFKRLGAIKK